MSTVCPACGVAVVPGYVRCPKCHAGLAPGATRTKRSSGDPGGTTLAQNGFPIAAVIVALAVVAAIILVFGVRSGGKKTEAAPAPPPEPIEDLLGASLDREEIEDAADLGRIQTFIG
jgi:hypothetical protein